MSLFGVKEKKKIIELNIKIDSLQKKILENKAKEDNLLDIVKKKDIEIVSLKKISKSPHDRQFEKITLEFDKVKTKNIDLKKLNEALILENLTLVAKNNEIIGKIKEFNKITDSLRRENKTLKQPKEFNAIKEESRYKILIKDLYSTRKFDEFKKFCENLGYIYMSELEKFEFENLIEKGFSKIKIQNAKNEYIKFKNNEFNPEIKEYLIHGHRISKVFFRYRNFVAYLTKIKIIFISQLENFDFENLKKENFSSVQIEKLKERINKYNDLRKK